MENFYMISSSAGTTTGAGADLKDQMSIRKGAAGSGSIVTHSRFSSYVDLG